MNDILTAAKKLGSQLEANSNIFPTCDIVYRKKGPKVVGDYILGDLLGSGSYGVVKEGAEIASRKRVAVKIMHSRRLMKIPGGEEAVRNEIRIQKSLSHPNITCLYGAFACPSKGKLYIIQEYSGGGNLQELIESAPDRKLPLCQCQRYFQGLISGLEYLHNLGIVHRDIKPENLLIGQNDTLKVTDFGVAEFQDEITNGKVSKTQGSPAFQPPEMASGTIHFSSYAADVWASGITLYFVSTGNYPFNGDSIYDLFENIAKGDFNLPIGIDEDLGDLIQNILQTEPAKRFTLQQIKDHRWMKKILAPEEEFHLSKRPTSFSEDSDGLVILPSIKATYDSDESTETSSSSSLNGSDLQNIVSSFQRENSNPYKGRSRNNSGFGRGSPQGRKATSPIMIESKSQSRLKESPEESTPELYRLDHGGMKHSIVIGKTMGEVYDITPPGSGRKVFGRNSSSEKLKKGGCNLL